MALDTEGPENDDPLPWQPYSEPPVPAPAQPATPEPPPPPSMFHLCCAARGNALPTLDDSDFIARRATRDLILGGRIVLFHPCGFSRIAYGAVGYDLTGARIELDTRRIDPLKEGTKVKLDILRKTPLRGILGGHLYIEAKSACGWSLHATLSPYGRTWTRPRK